MNDFQAPPHKEDGGKDLAGVDEAEWQVDVDQLHDLFLRNLSPGQGRVCGVHACPFYRGEVNLGNHFSIFA